MVGKFVEFFGEGAASLPLPDRATIANMAPEYGATMGFFPVDEATIDYFKGTGRTKEEIDAFDAYFKAQRPVRHSEEGRHRLHRGGGAGPSTSVAPSLAGPKRPQDRIELGNVKRQVRPNCSPSRSPRTASPRNPKTSASASRRSDGIDIGSGDVLIAAITSCTNTSNPGVLLAAGLLAKKAVEKGLTRASSTSRPRSRPARAWSPNT